MADSLVVNGIPPEVTDLSDLTEFAQELGPKRVDTKEVEIEAHNPLVVQRLMERRGSKAIRFGQFTGTYVRAKNACGLCNPTENNTECC